MATGPHHHLSHLKDLTSLRHLVSSPSGEGTRQRHHLVALFDAWPHHESLTLDRTRFNIQFYPSFRFPDSLRSIVCISGSLRLRSLPGSGIDGVHTLKLHYVHILDGALDAILLRLPSLKDLDLFRCWISTPTRPMKIPSQSMQQLLSLRFIENQFNISDARNIPPSIVEWRFDSPLCSPDQALQILQAGISGSLKLLHVKGEGSNG